MSEQTFDLSNNTLEIMLDQDTDSPREWDNLAKMIFVGKHAHLGDNHDFRITNNYNNRQDFMERGAEDVKKHFDAAIVKPVHLYSHSGTSISTSFGYPFNCQWDSGTCGFAVVTKADIRKEYGVKRITKALLEKADKILECEVKLLDQWISGDVYRFSLDDKEGNNIDGCGGFFGSDLKTNGMLEHLPEDVVKELEGQI